MVEVNMNENTLAIDLDFFILMKIVKSLHISITP